MRVVVRGAGRSVASPRTFDGLETVAAPRKADFMAAIGLNGQIY